MARNGAQSGHRAFDDARENPTGVTVKGVARVFFEPSDAVLLLEIVQGRGQRARCLPAEHPHFTASQRRDLMEIVEALWGRLDADQQPAPRGGVA